MDIINENYSDDDINEFIDYDISNSIILNIDTTYETNPKILLYKELMRYNTISGLNDNFKMKLNELPKDIYDTVELFKNNSCKLIELINRWCWHQYNNKTCCDNVIPYVADGKYEYDRFIEDLNYILKKNNNSKEISADDKIIQKLKEMVSNYLSIEIFNFKKKIENIQTKLNSTQLCDDLNINNDVSEKKNRLSTFYNNQAYQVIINQKVYDRLKLKLIMFGKKYNLITNCVGNIDNYLDYYIFCILFRYSYLDAGNQQLAINQYIKEMYKKCGVNFELFGSAINTVSSHYCSLFYDIEQYFGSNGNFNDIEIKKGIFWCNPPYDDTIMTNAAYKLIKILENSTEIAFVVTIPIWDKYTQDLLISDKIEYVTRKYTNTIAEQHDDHKIYSILKPFIKDEIIIPKSRIPYFNYKKYSNINAVNTYMLLVYNSLNKNIADKLSKNFDKIIALDKNNFFIK